MNTNEVPWSFIPIPELKYQLPVKPLHTDSETGMMVLKMKYDAGFTNPWHAHNCAHGMYVLDGILRTSKGDFGPGGFVWFAEGERMFHGATDENDAHFLFITNTGMPLHDPVRAVWGRRLSGREQNGCSQSDAVMMQTIR